MFKVALEPATSPPPSHLRRLLSRKLIIKVLARSVIPSEIPRSAAIHAATDPLRRIVTPGLENPLADNSDN
jgi:hypothetical protein